MTDETSSPTAQQLFERWYITPFKKLQSLDNGDGGWVAMMIGFALCERYFRSITNTTDDHQNNWAFRDKAVEHFEVEKELFSNFWNCFRNGIMHQAFPKHVQYSTDSKKKTFHYCLHADFDKIPTIKNVNNVQCICIEPFKFTASIFKIYEDNPEFISRLISHPIAEIGSSGTYPNAS